MIFHKFKKMVFSFGIFLSLSCLGLYPIQLLVDQQGLPTEQFLKLLELCDVHHDGTLANIVQETQKWLRPVGIERSDMHESNNLVDKRKEILDVLTQLGFVNEQKPLKKEYDYGVVLGAFIYRIRTRLAYFVEQWNEGVRFKKLVFLSGRRPIDSRKENRETFTVSDVEGLSIRKDWKLDNQKLPQTEIDVVRLVYEQSDLPEDFRKIPVVFIDAPMTIDESGNKKRPTTVDTVSAWLTIQPKAGTCLVSSNQPYVPYQDSILASLMPQEFEIETVGEGAGDSVKISDYLDTVARTLFCEQKKF